MAVLTVWLSGSISRNLEPDLKNLPNEISTLEIHVRLTLGTPPCKPRSVDIRRARDRPEQSTGPLTAPRGARPPLCSWPIWTGKSVFRWLKSTLHYLPRLFPTPPSCKRAGLSPASPGSRSNLSCGARARGGARARPVSRGAPRSHRGFSKTCFHGRLGARGKAHDSPPVLV